MVTTGASSFPHLSVGGGADRIEDASILLSHIISIPPGPHLLSDVIASSSILAGDEIPGGGDFGGGEASGSGGTGGGGGFEFGVDPEMDPELAMVLRMSMEEEQARQAAAAQAAASSSSSSEPLATVPESSSHPAAAASSAVAAPIAAPSAPVPKGAEPPLGADEDAELAAALALSSGGGVGNHDGDVEMGAEENDEVGREVLSLSVERYRTDVCVVCVCVRATRTTRRKRFDRRSR